MISFSPESQINKVLGDFQISKIKKKKKEKRVTTSSQIRQLVGGFVGQLIVFGIQP